MQGSIALVTMSYNAAIIQMIVRTEREEVDQRSSRTAGLRRSSDRFFRQDDNLVVQGCDIVSIGYLHHQRSDIAVR